MGAKEVFIRLWSALMMIFYVAVLGLGVVALVFISILPEIGIILLVLGVVGFLVAISGCIGAGYRKKDKEAEQGKTACFLIVFFAAMCFFHVVFVIFGVILIFLSKSLSLLELLPVGEFLDFMDAVPESWVEQHADVAAAFLNVVTKIKSFVLGIGIVLVVVSVFHLATIIITAFRIGKTLFAKFFVGICAFIDISVGLALGIVVLIMGFSKTSAFYGKLPSSIVIPLIVFGFVLAFIGFVGLFTCRLGVRYKVFTVIFNIGNIILLVGFFAMFIVSIIIYTKAVSEAQSYCNDDFCAEWVENANNNKCAKDYEDGIPCYEVENMIKAFEVLFKALASILIFICLYLVFFVGVVVFSTGVLCCKKDKTSEGGEGAQELYSADTNNQGVQLSKLVNWTNEEQ